jgi:fructokinase
MKYDIVTLGDCSEDIFVRPHESLIERSRHFSSGQAVSFELGEKINLDAVEYQIGGSAGNTAVAFSRMGYSVGIVSPLGFDSVAEKIFSTLNEENVDTKYIDQKKNIQSNFSLVFNFGSERTIFVYHGLDDYGQLKLPAKINSKWLYLAPVGHGEDDLFKKIITLAAEKNLKITWNPGARQIEKGASHYSSLLKMTTILSLNKEEAIKFTNFPVRPNIKEICKRLHLLGAKLVVITDGKNGAYCSDGSNLWQVDVLPAKRVDATGAGDSFTAAFVAKFIDDEITLENIEIALKIAIVESTSVISFVGAQTGLLTKSQIEKELNRLPRLRVEEI